MMIADSITKEVPLIGTGRLQRGSLAGQVAVVTGAGRGIGFEAARALTWLGAHVVIAEIDEASGSTAVERLDQEMGTGAATFIPTDVGNTESVVNLARQVLTRHRQVHIVLNNATIAPMGAVTQAPIQSWDAGYRVNLRGPVLLARAFIPSMIRFNEGVFVCVSSSGTAPYRGPYEVLKTAQFELANTLAGELKETGITVFTISPGVVRTTGADAAVAQLASLYGKSLEEFYALSADRLFSVETAGAGFAASVALAPRFNGMEISVIQALQVAGIPLPERHAWEQPLWTMSKTEQDEALALVQAARCSLSNEYEGWKRLPEMERQRILSTFQTHAGLDPRSWLERLAWAEHCLETGALEELAAMQLPLHRLVHFYEEWQTLPLVREAEDLEAILREARGAQRDSERLAVLLGVSPV